MERNVFFWNVILADKIGHLTLNDKPVIGQVFGYNGVPCKVVDIREMHISYLEEMTQYHYIVIAQPYNPSTIGVRQIQIFRSSTTMYAQFNEWAIENKSKVHIFKTTYQPDHIAVEYALLNEKDQFFKQLHYASYENNGEEIKYFNKYTNRSQIYTNNTLPSAF